MHDTPPNSTPEHTPKTSGVSEEPARYVDPTGVPGLDIVLGGGLPRGGLTIVTGPPGSGKTILTTQIAFAAAHVGRRAVIITALSEPPGKLLAHLNGFSFVDPTAIGDAVQIVSLQGFLGSGKGLRALADEIISIARKAKAAVVAVDGFSGIRGEDSDPQEARRFLYRLAGTLGALGMTIIVANEANPRDPVQFPEATTADAIIGLQFALVGARQRRGIEATKLRGAAPLPGLHSLTLGATGMIVYPRLESRVVTERSGDSGEADSSAWLATPGIEDAPMVLPAPLLGGGARHNRAAFGLLELDELLGGGLTRGTSTVLAGSLGTGKTLQALHFTLTGVQAGESVVYVGFRENMRQLAEKADAFALGTEVRAALAPEGGLTLLHWDAVDLNPDILADRILRAIDATRARRLVVDSVIELERAVIESSDRDRVDGYMAALVKAVRKRDVTALFIRETQRVVSQGIEFAADELSVLAENVLLQQQVSYNAQLHRVLSVIKMRFSAHDVALREYSIAPPAGIRVLTPLESGEDVLQGIARLHEDSSDESKSGARRTGRASRSSIDAPEDPREGSVGGSV